LRPTPKNLNLKIKKKFRAFYRYFFFVLTALIVLGLFNGLVFLPVLLVMLGPPGEVVPADHGDAIAPPTPELPGSGPNRKRTSGSRPSTSRQPSLRIAASPVTTLTAAKRHNSDISLSTIAEESNTYSSSSASHCCPKTPECSRRHCSSAPMTSLNGASVFVEPHVTVETTTYVSTSKTFVIFLSSNSQ
jgi:hypothetical protein